MEGGVVVAGGGTGLKGKEEWGELEVERLGRLKGKTKKR